MSPCCPWALIGSPAGVGSAPGGGDRRAPAEPRRARPRGTSRPLPRPSALFMHPAHRHHHTRRRLAGHGIRHGQAMIATLRHRLISVPARLVHHASALILRLPTGLRAARCGPHPHPRPARTPDQAVRPVGFQKSSQRCDLPRSSSGGGHGHGGVAAAVSFDLRRFSAGPPGRRPRPRRLTLIGRVSSTPRTSNC